MFQSFKKTRRGKEDFTRIHKHCWWWIEVENCENEQQVTEEEDLHCFQILLRHVCTGCVCVCVCVCKGVHVFVCALISLFLQPRLLPAKSKVGGGRISTSLHDRERWGGGGRGGGVIFCNKAGWKRSLLTDRHPHKPAASDTWGSRVFLPPGNRSTSLSATLPEPHQLSQQKHTLCDAWCSRLQGSKGQNTDLPARTRNTFSTLENLQFYTGRVGSRGRGCFYRFLLAKNHNAKIGTVILDIKASVVTLS